MRFLPLQLRSIASASLILAVAWKLDAQVDRATVSPFLPAKSPNATVVAPVQVTPIELRAVVHMPDGVYCAIFDTAKKSAVWLRLNETGRSYVVRSHSLVGGTDQVTVDHNGTTVTLKLKTPKIGSAPVGMVAAPPPPSGGPPMMNATPVDEATRLQAVAEDVARRRALRQQAASGTTTTPQPAPPPPPQR